MKALSPQHISCHVRAYWSHKKQRYLWAITVFSRIGTYPIDIETKEGFSTRADAEAWVIATQRLLGKGPT